MSTDASDPSGPRNVCVVLLDSLNRHMLGSYASDCSTGAEFATPNLDRFAQDRAVRFTNHVTGSLPCMPARHDILCGALDFLWKPWGSIEVWEQPITRVLHQAGVTSFLATDHPHLFEMGGENYHVDFSGWDYTRGHEGDMRRTYADPSFVGTPANTGGWFFARQFGIEMDERGWDRTRTHLRDEADHPGPRTMTAAADFLNNATPHHDRWFLFVDEFDPHEPFDTPEPWQGMYDDEPWPGEHGDELMIWPPYVVGGIADGHITAAEGRHIRGNYGSKLSMIDHWFGKIIEAFDQQDLWDDTALIVCTDHGHYLGDERQGPNGRTDIWGKPGVPQFEPLGHTPLLIHWPGAEPASGAGQTCDALTTNVDLFATIADVFDVSVGHRTHGTSLVPLLDGRSSSVRDWAIGGVWGNWVQVTDGRHKYARAPVAAGGPLSMWSNRWSTMPVHISGFEGLPAPDQRAWLDTMPGTDIPVIRQPYAAGDRTPFWAGGPRIVGQHHLYDVVDDPDENENRVGEPAEPEMIDLLRTAMTSLEAPDDQLQRLGIH